MSKRSRGVRERPPTSHAAGPNVVDSSGCLEYFADGPNASRFAPAIENIGALVVPSITLYEVYKRLDEQRGRADAQRGVAQMIQGRVIDPDAHVAPTAALRSRSEHLPMADSIILATSRLHQAELWTQDHHFANKSGVHYFPKVVQKEN
ncbi:MAG TPA: type II toxin-antitoxin system VapC family toxin [Gemmatimonadaceae bacterium]|nr:type II toxin-antitoxin system VapC family toxin [Gemmatimonadaceae bacterium]